MRCQQSLRFNDVNNDSVPVIRRDEMNALLLSVSVCVVCVIERHIIQMEIGQLHPFALELVM